MIFLIERPLESIDSYFLKGVTMKTVKESINIKEKLIKNFFDVDRTISLDIKKGELVYHITPLDFKIPLSSYS